MKETFLRTNADQGRLDAFLAGYELLRDTTIAATAEPRFSQGVPWPVDVISHDPPVQSAATGNRITLKPEFFVGAADGMVTLVCHFWSGERTTHRITKAGDQVTGSP
ncbi:hypothetical protein [Actinosynnema sp.]|uniref:hypothetical protein n=1 Tax=Actinosynnema sp. TaxID=1872144 RepID=UPI003F84FAE2